MNRNYSNATRKTRVTVTLLLTVAAASAPLQAADYPSRPIRFVVGFTPGGSSDTAGRIVGQKLSERIKQQVVIDNRGGAGGNIATEIVAKAAPDGYTLLLGTPGPLTITPNLRKDVPFDTLKDFQPVTQIGSTSPILLAHPSVASSVKELVAAAKSRPGKLNYASSGVGTSNHLAAELFNLMAGVSIVHVPFKGSGQNLPSLIAGEVQITFGPLTPALPIIRTGKLKGLAVTGLKRSRSAPEIPTIDESGVPGYQVDSWYSVLLPAGASKAIVTLLNRELVDVIRQPETSALLIKEGVDPVASTPEQFAAHIRTEMEKWKNLIAKIKL